MQLNIFRLLKGEKPPKHWWRCEREKARELANVEKSLGICFLFGLTPPHPQCGHGWMAI